MPLYDIEHVISLSDEQQEALAKAFTSIHCRRFQTPSFFINVRFTDVSLQKVYRGGVLRKYNRAILRTRVSENRSKEMYGDHCRELIRAWDEIVISKSELKIEGTKEDRSLRTVWVLGALTTAVEMGIQRPSAGEEIEWLKEHKNEFKRLADDGDEDMQGLMQELATRQEFAEVI
jgi:phenylpyruvate tautomerase PptA (4-oxalocrotonate tautomerase family)